MNLRIAVVEDEAEAANLLSQCLLRYGREGDHVFQISPFSDAAIFLQEYSPQLYDLIFMDIRMPGLDGMTAAEKLRQIDPLVPLVFVTSLVQFAVKGYEVDALDFIVKPIRYSSFKMKMKRILLSLERHQEVGIPLTIEGSVRIFPASDIYFVEVTDHQLTYHTAQGNFTSRGKLSQVEQKLPQDMFYRCSNSYLINLRHVEQVSGEDILCKGTTIRLSRAKKKEFLSTLTAFLGKGG